MAQLVAHHTGSVGVRGSNPLSSTRKNGFPQPLGRPVDDDFDARSSGLASVPSRSAPVRYRLVYRAGV